MPFHLSPISRRRFLARSLAAGSGLLVAHQLLAKEKAVDKDCWALLSDIHLAADRSKVERGVNMTQNFETVSKELLELRKRPEAVFINGDCAFNSGQKSDYELIKNLLDPLRAGQMPLHLTVGNHDNREQLWDVLKEAKTVQGPLPERQVSLLRSPKVNWIMLDSLEKTLQTPGLLGKEQLAWLAETLDENANKPAVVMIHHNPGLDGNMGLKDTVALFEVIRPRKQVKAYIYGHTHAWKVEQDESGIHLINLPPTAYVFREGEPSGWVQARVRKDGMQLEVNCVDKKHKAHGETHELKWRS